jgi:hypothetical protein
MIPPSDRQQIFRPRHLTVTRPTEIFARMSHVLLAQSYGILELRRALNRSSTKWEPANAALRPQRPPHLFSEKMSIAGVATIAVAAVSCRPPYFSVPR